MNLESYQSERSVPYTGDALKYVYDMAIQQAHTGKGAIRHAYGNEPFQDQLICDMDRRLHADGAGPLYQAVKKIYESRRLHADARVRELLGALNYTAAAIVLEMEKIDAIHVTPKTDSAARIHG